MEYEEDRETVLGSSFIFLEDLEVDMEEEEDEADTEEEEDGEELSIDGRDGSA